MKILPDLKSFDNRRYGKVKITRDMYSMFWKSCKFDIIPLSIEYKPCSEIFELECFCELFRELNESDALPEYVIIFQKINNHVCVEKIEEVSFLQSFKNEVKE